MSMIFEYIHEKMVAGCRVMCPKGVRGSMTRGWMGVRHPISERYPLLITKTCLCTHLYDEIWRKEKSGQKDSCLANSRPKNPPIGAVRTRTLNMLCMHYQGFDGRGIGEQIA